MAMHKQQSLSDLPSELLLLLPEHLHSLEELYALMLTSKRLYLIYKGISRNILRLAANTKSTLPGLRPFPHFLLSLVARRLADWAVRNDERKSKLHNSFGGGVQSLLNLAVEVVDDGITLDDIRQTWCYKQDVLNPISREVDLCCGPSSGNPLTVCNEPDTTLFNWIIYGDLFHHSISAIYDDPRPAIVPLSTASRYKFLVYCIPDVNCFENTVGFPAWFEDYKETGEDMFQQLSLLTAMAEILGAESWRKALGREKQQRHTYNQDTDTPVTKEDLFISSVMHLGSKSLRVLRPGGLDAVKDDILAIEAKIDSLSKAAEVDQPTLGKSWDDPWLESLWITLKRDTMVTVFDDTPWEGEDMTAFLAAIR